MPKTLNVIKNNVYDKIILRFSLIGLFIFQNYSIHAQLLNQQDAESKLIGQPASNWIIKQGSFKNISEFKGSLILLEFDGVGCGASQKVIPDLNEIDSIYSKDNFHIIVIEYNPQVSKDLAKIKFYEKQYAKDSYLLKGVEDKVNMIDYKDFAKKYNQSGFPTFYLIDKNGIIVYSHLGYFYDDSKKELIEKIKKFK